MATAVIKSLHSNRYKLSWQKLGEGFDKQQFRFQVLDEGLYESWQDELNKMISA
jgi:hypothetical protein